MRGSKETFTTALYKYLLWRIIEFCHPTCHVVRCATERVEGGGDAGTEKPVSRKRRRRDQDKDEEPLGGKGQGWGTTLQHVNLFSDAEREAGKRLGQNIEHQREKKEQDLQTQQRSGLAPTALGEGSAELKGKDSQPWYSQSKYSSTVPESAARTVRLGREVTGREAEEAIKRDQGRKGQADPMGSLFRSGTQPTSERLPSGKMGVGPDSGAPSLELFGAARVQIDATGTRVDEHDHERPKRSKKAKRDKKENKRKKQKKRSKERHRNTNGNRDGNPTVDGSRGPTLVRTTVFWIGA